MLHLGLPAVYLLCFLAGVAIERTLIVNQILLRAIAIATLAAAQLLLSIQLLSLGSWLTAGKLLLANFAATALVWIGSRSAGPSLERKPWRQLWREARAAFEDVRKERETLLLVAFAAGSMLLTVGLGALMLPTGDIYHFEMPLYWRQHASLLPFAINDPRVVTTSFLAEALALPGYLYANSGLMFIWLTLLGAALGMAVVFGLARGIGCDRAAAAGAAALLVGGSAFNLNLLNLRACNYWAGAWTGASMLFLFELVRSREKGIRRPMTMLGGSVACLCMACGAKNPTVVIVPVYLGCLVLALGRHVRTPAAWLTCAGSAAAGIACSGVAWNYVENARWFGDPRGPAYMQQHVSRDYSLPAIWTRMLRGAGVLVCDTVYLPPRWQPASGAVARKAIEALGGRERLAEDAGFHSVLERTFEPRKAFGLIGVLFLMPGMILAVMKVAQPGVCAPPWSRERSASLLWMVIGAFVLGHAFLRWQSNGLYRVMPFFAVLAAPFCGLALARRWARVSALLVLALSLSVFALVNLSVVARRFDLSPSVASFARLAGAKEWGRDGTFQAKGEAAGSLRVREGYTDREILQAALRDVPDGSRIGFVAGEGFESYYLFGPRLINEVTSLTDSNQPGRIIALPRPAPSFLVIQAPDDARRRWAFEHGYESLAEAWVGGLPLIGVFQLKSSRVTGVN